MTEKEKEALLEACETFADIEDYADNKAYLMGEDFVLEIIARWAKEARVALEKIAR